jgi:hypothetical protein
MFCKEKKNFGKIPEEHVSGLSDVLMNQPTELKKKPRRAWFLYGVSTGIRTPVPTVKGWCPRPLDDGDKLLLLHGRLHCAITRTT